MDWLFPVVVPAPIREVASRNQVHPCGESLFLLEGPCDLACRECVEVGNSRLKIQLYPFPLPGDTSSPKRHALYPVFLRGGVESDQEA